MKKNIATYRLNRDTTARKALFNNLIRSLVSYEQIETTSAKARAVRGQFEKLVTKAKAATLNSRRQVQSILQNNQLVKKLMDEIAPRYQESKGGYTKLTPLGARRGDGALMVRLELTKKVALDLKPKKEDQRAKTKNKAKSSLLPKKIINKNEKINVAKVVAPRTGRRGDR